MKPIVRTCSSCEKPTGRTCYRVQVQEWYDGEVPGETWVLKSITLLICPKCFAADKSIGQAFDRVADAEGGGNG
jgi:hypothetical protein